jgi:predicted RNase H-like nuclease (RuvC/YqgF family)
MLDDDQEEINKLTSENDDLKATVENLKIGFRNSDSTKEIEELKATIERLKYENNNNILMKNKEIENLKATIDKLRQDAEDLKISHSKDKSIMHNNNQYQLDVFNSSEDEFKKADLVNHFSSLLRLM